MLSFNAGVASTSKTYPACATPSADAVAVSKNVGAAGGGAGGADAAGAGAGAATAAVVAVSSLPPQAPSSAVAANQVARCGQGRARGRACRVMVVPWLGWVAWPAGCAMRTHGRAAHCLARRRTAHPSC